MSAAETVGSPIEVRGNKVIGSGTFAAELKLTSFNVDSGVPRRISGGLAASGVVDIKDRAALGELVAVRRSGEKSGTLV